MVDKAEEEEGEWGKSVEDGLKQALLSATMGMEATRLAAEEQIQRMECEVARLRCLLDAAVRQRDEAREQARHALLLLAGPTSAPATRPPPQSDGGTRCLAVDSEENNCPFNPLGGMGASSSSSSPSSEESSVVVSSPLMAPPAVATQEVDLFKLVPMGKLPEKGRLLEAVVEAGPLLKNLMLVGPLPQWRHPPPPLHYFEIPPVSLSVTTTATTTTTTATTRTLAGQMRPGFTHHSSTHNSKKRERGREGEWAAVVEACGRSSPSSSSRISSTSKTGNRQMHPKVGPFLHY